MGAGAGSHVNERVPPAPEPPTGYIQPNTQMEKAVTTTTDLTAALAVLRDDYTYRVNLLLDEGREDLAARLADRYVEDAARLVAAA
jgi:hypothetical protein